VLTTVSVTLPYGRLIGAGGFGGDGAGAAMPTVALHVAFAGCSMSAFEKAVPIADMDRIVSRRTQARRLQEDRRWRRDRALI